MSSLAHKKLHQVRNVWSQTRRVVHNNLTNSVQEEVLLSVFYLLDHGEDFLQEEIRVSNCNVSQTNRSCLSNFFILRMEERVNNTHVLFVLGEVLSLTEFSNAESTTHLSRDFLILSKSCNCW